MKSGTVMPRNNIVPQKLHFPLNPEVRGRKVLERNQLHNSLLMNHLPFKQLLKSVIKFK